MDTAFFIASKFAGALAMPGTLIALVLLASFIALQIRHVRLARGFLGSALIMVVGVGVLPVDHWALRTLEDEYPANPRLRDVQSIIVLGGGIDGDVTAEWRQTSVNEAGDRYIAAVTLAQRYPQAKLYVVGGTARLDGQGVSEAVVARSLIRSLGIAEHRIVLEGESRTTAENASRLFKLVKDKGQGEWVLVTSAFHMRRAMESFCAAGWRDLISYPTDYRTSAFSDRLDWSPAAHLEGLTTATKEWVGLIGYRWSGKAEPCTSS